jgi:hypothetical protein
MCSVGDRVRGSAFLIVISTIALACSSSGDQILGRVVSDNAAPIFLSDAGPSSIDATIGDCDSIEVEAKAIPFDFYALIDRSQSMQDPDIDKWELLVTSFTRFLQSGVANGTGFGVGFFPMGPDDMCRNDPRPCNRGGPSCDPNMYANARVEIRSLPDNYQPLAMSIFQQPAGGPTLTRPALQGSLVHASRWEFSHPGRRVVQILITGGPPSPDACQPNNVTDCANVVSLGSSKTYVIAFGTDKTTLDPIAVAGGGEAYSIDIRDMMTDRLGEIVKQIRDIETGCEWAVPPPPSPGFDYGKLNVEVTGLLSSAPQVTTVLKKVKNRQACDTMNSPYLEWYYDNNIHPTRIIACNATCKGIHQSAVATTRISLGCQSLTTGPTK